MSRPARIALRIVAGAAALTLLLTLAAVIVVQTQWFHDYVRGKIAGYAESATGGAVNIGAFRFDWTHLHAEVDDFVLHGTEPANAAPLFRARRIDLVLRLAPSFSRTVKLQSLDVLQPAVNVIVSPDGRTNVPAPKAKPASNQTVLEDLVDIAIGRFNIENGLIQFADRKAEFSAQGENLKTQLSYNTVGGAYDGQLSMSPLFVRYGGNGRLDLNVVLPLHLERDKVQLTNAKISTGASELIVNGAMQHLTDPAVSARVNARVALSDVKRAAGASIPLDLRGGAPRELTADVAFSMDKDRIQVSTARMNLGRTNLEASGALRDPSGSGAAQFHANLALGELAELFDVAARPEGDVRIGGEAKLAAAGYSLHGKLDARNISVREGGKRYSNIALASAIDANQNEIQLTGMKLAALGGDFTGNATLEQLRRFRLKGALRNFDLRQLSRLISDQPLGYDGVLSGPVEAAGDLKAPGVSGMEARARLSIAPGRGGVPVSGRLNASFNGATGAVDVGNSYIALPSSRMELSGNLGGQIRVNVTSKNLNDFLPALALGSSSPLQQLPVSLDPGGLASFQGTVGGSLGAPRIDGRLTLSNFRLEDRPFDRLAADLTASSTGASIQNASLTRGALQANFAVNVGLHRWKPEQYDPIAATASIRNAGLADVMALAGQKDARFTGALNADARIQGTVGNPQGSAALTVVDGTAYDQRFDRFSANVNFTDQLVTVPNAQLTSGPARVDLNASFRHPRDSFETGALQLHIASNQMPLDQFRAPGSKRAELGGALQLNADAAATLERLKQRETLRVNRVDASVNARGIRYEGQNYGDFTATAQTSGSTVAYRVNSDFAGSTIRAEGQTRLAEGYPTTLSASIAALPIERVLAIAGRKDLPASGKLSANAAFSGSLSDPRVTADMRVANGSLYEQPIDALQANFTYTNQAIDIPSLTISSGAAKAQFSGSLTHPAGDFKTGQLRFDLKANQVQLAQIREIQKRKPGLAGAVEITAKGAGKLQDVAGQPPILLSSLDANVSARGLDLNKQPLGDAALTAETRGGNVVFDVNSDFARSKIQGHGEMRLAGDYPIEARVNFSNLTYEGVRAWMGNSANGALTQPGVTGVVEGAVTVSGPALKSDELTASLRIPRLELSAAPRGAIAGKNEKVTLRNEGPIVASLSRSMIRVDSAHIVGPQTDIAISGTAALAPKQDLNLTIAATSDLSIVQNFNRNVYSSGAVTLEAVVRGPIDDPRINGELRLKNAAFNLIDAPNGIANANGLIVFNGKTAIVQSLTAESGGGSIAAGGNVSFGGGLLRFRLTATAKNVRVRYPESVSTFANASLTFTGTSDRSTLAGNVTVDRIEFTPHSDFGSVLASGSNPVKTPSAPNSLLAGVHLQVQVRTAPGVEFQTALAQNVEAVADLRVRGTLDEPSVLGRINITQGQMVFFGTKYTVDQGSVAFYNPVRIEPVLNVDLETNAQGVDVILTVSGTVDHLNLTYRSDPPLPFNQVLALLAAGKTPSDPTIAARQPQPPSQNLQQVGESAILTQVVANPLSSRLERVFGITELKIAPAFVTGSVLPQARVTLSQQITRNLTFTYITDVANTNEQIIQVEWAVNPQWSAVATRDQNGLFGIDFYYKKKFR